MDTQFTPFWTPNSEILAKALFLPIPSTHSQRWDGQAAHWNETGQVDINRALKSTIKNNLKVFRILDLNFLIASQLYIFVRAF